MTAPSYRNYEHFKIQYNLFVSERLKSLLETKHMYQRCSIAPDQLSQEPLLLAIIAKDPGQERVIQQQIAQFISDSFRISDKFETLQTHPNTTPVPVLCLVVTNVKLFCRTCNAREAYRPVWFSDVTSSVKQNAHHLMSGERKFKVAFGPTFQLFSIAFQCQRCEGNPEVFLVRRDRTELFLEGRSPIEHVEIAAFIPREERKWFRDAVIAYQSTKILAALFYLRTFIEQFARRKTGLLNEKKTGDEIMSAYSATLPNHLRDSMPSLGECYERLSECLHKAEEDESVFETSRQRIEKHFDIRRVHELG